MACSDRARALAAWAYQVEYKNRVDAVNYLMRDMDLPHDLRRRMREYIRTTKETQKRFGFADLVQKNFSDELAQEIHFKISGAVFANSVPYLAKLAALSSRTNQTSTSDVRDDATDLPSVSSANTFLEKLSPLIERVAYAPGEMIDDPADAIYIIMRGTATRWGQVLTRGDYFGHDTIVACPVLRDSRPVRVLSHLEVAKLRRTHIFALLESNDGLEDVAQFLKIEALKLATGCAVTLASLFAKQSNERKRRTAEQGGAPSEELPLSSAFKQLHGVLQRKSTRPGVAGEVWNGVEWRFLPDEHPLHQECLGWVDYA